VFVPTDPPRPGALITVGVSLIVVAADVFTAVAFGLGCRLGENSAQTWLDFCESPLPVLPWFGAGAVIAGAVLARWRRSSKPWLIGALLGAASAMSLWVLMGDPAGNFSGIRTQLQQLDRL
jgi:hypothetical protein